MSTSPDHSRAISRRAVLAAAAWSAPVIALAAAAPAAAATNGIIALVTTTDRVIPSTAYGAITITLSGTVVAGVAVTVTLPPGATWADDGTSAPRVLVTDTAGVIVLSGTTTGVGQGPAVIGAPTEPTSGQITASAAGYGSATGTLTTSGVNLVPRILIAPGIAPFNTPTGMTWTIRVSNLDATLASGTGAIVRVNKSFFVATLSGSSDAGWSLDSTTEPSNYVLTYSGAIPAGDRAVAVLSGTYTATAHGTQTITAVVQNGSGWDNTPGNNSNTSGVTTP